MVVVRASGFWMIGPRVMVWANVAEAEPRSATTNAHASGRTRRTDLLAPDPVTQSPFFSDARAHPGDVGGGRNTPETTRAMRFQGREPGRAARPMAWRTELGSACGRC